MGWYNGYPQKQRDAKYKVLVQALRDGSLTPYSGPCMLCGDPEVPVEPHSEDYSSPFLWDPPGMFWLCTHCHKNKLHGRFRNPSLWKAFLAHVRRGGYAREWLEPTLQREIRVFRAALQRIETAHLATIRHRDIQDAWWEKLSTERQTLTSDRPALARSMPPSEHRLPNAMLKPTADL